MLAAVGTQNIDSLAGKCIFCKPHVEAKQIVSMHWKQKHWFSYRKMYMFSDRRGYVGGRGNAKHKFFRGKCRFLTAQVVTVQNVSDWWFGAPGRGYY